MKISLLLIVSIVMGVIVTGCNNTDENVVEVQDEVQATLRAVGTKTPTLTVYVETNDINPLNAGEYYFCGTSPQEQVVDRVILFASNIRGNATDVWLHHNSNQACVLSNAATLIQPLQAKGIKVMLGVLGDWTGVGFANLTDPMIDDFAQEVVNCINTYGLDGVDFDDEYANYGAIGGLPSPSALIYGKLIQKVDSLLPAGKLVTAFRYGYATGFDATTLAALDYMWPNFGCNATVPTGFSAAKWAKLSIQVPVSSTGSTNPVAALIQSCANSYSGYGAVMMFNLREWNASGIMNNFSSRVWGGRTVCWTGTSHAKTC